MNVLFVASLSIGSLASAGQANYNAMYVFGDSLSDTGNDFVASSAVPLVPAIPPSVSPFATYWRGRFTNGPVAVEYLWDLMQKKPGSEVAPSLATPNLSAKTAVSFAYGGATSAEITPTPLSGLTVPGMIGQVRQFQTALAGRRAPTNALYVVWTGANDYLQGWTSDPSVVVGNIVWSIRQLHALGARSFLVPNLPDLGLTPFVQDKGPAAFTQVSVSHNLALGAALTALTAEIPSLRLVTVDVFALGARLVADGQVIAMPPALAVLAPEKPAVVSCLFLNPQACVDVNLSAFLPPFLFWDVLHPTTQVHGLIGTAMYSSLMRQP